MKFYGTLKGLLMAGMCVHAISARADNPDSAGYGKPVGSANRPYVTRSGNGPAPSARVEHGDNGYASLPAAERPAAPPWLAVLKQYDPISGRLAFGTRVLKLKLQRSRKGEPFEDSFVGSINKLSPVQDRNPNRLFVQYAVMPYVGIGYQRDRLEIKTLTTMPPEERVDERNTDGNVVMRGRLPYLFLRVPNPTPVTPFVEFGKAQYRNAFRADPDWYDGGKRNFILASSSETDYWGAGVQIEICEHFFLDAYYRAMDIDVPGEYHFKGDDRLPEPFVFTLKHKAYGMGAMFRF